MQGFSGLFLPNTFIISEQDFFSYKYEPVSALGFSVSDVDCIPKTAHSFKTTHFCVIECKIFFILLVPGFT